MGKLDIISSLERFYNGPAALIDLCPPDGYSYPIVWANDDFASFFDLTSEDIVFEHAENILDQERMYLRAGLNTLLNGRNIRGQFVTKSQFHAAKWIDVEIQPQTNEAGAIRYVIAYLRDISDLSDQPAHITVAKDSPFADQKVVEALNALPDGIAIYDKEDNLQFWNSAFADIYKDFPEFLSVGKSFEHVTRDAIKYDIFDLKNVDPEVWVAKLLHERRTKKIAQSEIQLTDGRWLMRKEYRLLTGEVFSIRIDISELKLRERDLEEAQTLAEKTQQRLWNAVNGLPVAFVLYDSEDVLVMCNDRYKDTYDRIGDIIKPGITFEEIVRKTIGSGNIPDAVGREEEWIQERLVEFKNPGASRNHVMTGDRHFQVTESQLPNGDTVGFRLDITEMTRQRRQLEELAADLEQAKLSAEHEALHDGLTGLANRRHFDARLEKIIEENEDQNIAILHVDLDYFKYINDTLGHAAGDFVLRYVTDILLDLTNGFVARVGGDEFVILLENVNDKAGPSKLAEMITLTFSVPIDYAERKCYIGASIGIALGKAKDAKDLMLQSDIALYDAKDAGKNRYTLFSPSLRQRHEENKGLSSEIREGLENGEFIAYFQPQFDSITHDCVGAEALVRWNHPTRGVLTPNIFLPIAEEMRIIDQIDSAVLDNAYKFCTNLESAGLSLPKISVNVSGRRLIDGGLINDIDRFKNLKTKLAFELLETIFLDDVRDESSWIIDVLNDHGIDIEIDDFGSGHASIVGLLKTNPKRLKIDRQLVLPITKSKKELDMVSAIVDIGRAQNIDIIAEGVETMEHSDILASLGVETLQGYAFARPMPADELHAFLANDSLRQSA